MDPDQIQQLVMVAGVLVGRAGGEITINHSEVDENAEKYGELAVLSIRFSDDGQNLTLRLLTVEQAEAEDAVPKYPVPDLGPEDIGKALSDLFASLGKTDEPEVHWG